MISPEEKKKLKTYLKSDYSSDVLAVLAERHIVSKFQKPYSASMIRNVFNGKTQNFDIEKAILEVYRRKAEQHKAQQIAKDNLLSSLS